MDMFSLGIDSTTAARQSEEKAKAVAQALTTAYPKYLWMVGVHPGGTLAIKLLMPGLPQNVAEILHLRNEFSYTELAAKAVRLGGDLLERMNLKRGAWDGSTPKNGIDMS